MFSVSGPVFFSQRTRFFQSEDPFFRVPHVKTGHITTLEDPFLSIRKSRLNCVVLWGSFNSSKCVQAGITGSTGKITSVVVTRKMISALLPGSHTFIFRRVIRNSTARFVRPSICWSVGLSVTLYYDFYVFAGFGLTAPA